METKQAEYRTDISLLAEKMSENIGRIEKDAAQRETRLILAVAGMLALAVAVLGFLIGLPTD